jgi:hypothetical protein
MKNFKLRVDEKITVWETTYVEVDAETKAEAIQKVIKGEYSGSTETEWDTAETMTLGENDGHSTLMVYKGHGRAALEEDLIYQNGK